MHIQPWSMIRKVWPILLQTKQGGPSKNGEAARQIYAMVIVQCKAIPDIDTFHLFIMLLKNLAACNSLAPSSIAGETPLYTQRLCNLMRST